MLATKTTQMDRKNSRFRRLYPTSMPTSSSLCFLWLLLPLCGLGCGSADPLARYTVTGKVTFQSKPVEEGAITFEDPTAGQVNSATLGSGGSYSLEVPAGELEIVKAKVPELMQSVAQLDVPLVVEVGVGDNWDKAH